MNLLGMWLLAQQDFGDQNGDAAGGIVAMMFSCCMFTFGAGFAIATIAGMWMAFAKAGKPGWAAIVPIYNYIIWLEIAGKPIWWVLLFFIPCVNLIIAIIVFMEIAKNFGQGPIFGIGMAFLPFIFWPMLGFGSAQYLPPKPVM